MAAHVQLSGQKPADEYNGLEALLDRFIEPGSEPVVAVVIIEVAKVVDNKISGEMYPVVRFARIEPVLDGSLEEHLRQTLKAAADKRLGNARLTFPQAPPNATADFPESVSPFTPPATGGAS